MPQFAAGNVDVLKCASHATYKGLPNVTGNIYKGGGKGPALGIY